RAIRGAAQARADDPHGRSGRRGERRPDPRLSRGARDRRAQLTAGLPGASPPMSFAVPYGTALELTEWIVRPVRSMKSKRATAGTPGSTLIVTTLKRSRSNSLTWVRTPGSADRKPRTDGGSSRKIVSMPIAPATISGVKWELAVSTR